ncbi:MAG: serine/threonine-protein kinase [Candidatus Eisenbacteria bacterium]|uniref:Serine/threonine-protein kinase n=1 Tax=Eiseniibacteriota bacterium TaxID=2212470 RepID=A0A849SVC1_UNCEI|nr:serine/threonine-protein kinase [Candidatus Eisenbacteria bacterium]
MSLTSGTRLGPYEILGPLGAGGMGEVYRARDTRLDRDVAIKALPDAFARDREHVSRFLREGRALASLNHPNIGAIHGLEESGDRSYLILELVEGLTLADRLSRGPLPLAEAIRIGRQIATGLEAAHESGIVHRDLKPGNVMLTRTDQAKVLDFGLAMDFGGARDAAMSAAATLHKTIEGTVLGTPAYMSPEQASGKPTDRRTDIWAFGCVLYECLVGRPAFAGDNYAEIIARVLHADPDWAELPGETPDRLRALLERCLVRDPTQRLRDIGEARIALQDAAPAARSVRTQAPRGVSARSLGALAALVAVLATAVGIGISRLPWPARSQPLTLVDLALPDTLALYGWGSPVLAFAPDGRTLAYAAVGPSGMSRIYVHQLADGVVREIPGSETGEGPFFSPDGSWVAFAVGTSRSSFQIPSELRKFSLSAGLTQTVCAIHDYFGGCWDGDQIVLQEMVPGPLMRVPAAGGALSKLIARPTTPDSTSKQAWPQLLPGGPYILVSDWSQARTKLGVIDRRSGALRRLEVDGVYARYLGDHRLLCVTREGQAMVVPFDPKRGAVTGAPVAVLKDVSRTGNEAAIVAYSGAGHLAWSSGLIRNSGIEEMQLVRVDAAGHITPLPVPRDLYGRGVRVSPDGGRLVVSDEWTGPWLVELGLGRRSRIVQEEGYEFPAWMPDGRSVVFMKLGAPFGIMLMEARSGATPRLVGSSVEEINVYDVTRDGREVTFVGSHSGDVRSVPLDGTGSEKVLLRGAAARSSALSPDGRWLAFSSGLGGQVEVFVERLGGGERTQVSTAGGESPRWARDGRELYFVSGSRLVAARFTPSEPPQVGQPEALGAVPDLRGYDVLPGHRQFVALQRPPDAGYVRRLRLALHWTPESGRLLGGSSQSKR